MKNLGIDIKKIVPRAAGLTTGAIVAGKVSNMSIMQKFATPAAKGAALAILGFVVAPIIAHKTGLNKAGKGEFINGITDGIGLVGALTIGHSMQPTLIPGVAGIGGYEENPIQGLGALADTDNGMYGAEDDGVSGAENDGMGGYEANPTVYGTDDYEI